MSINPTHASVVKPIHSWLRIARLAYVQGYSTPLLEQVIQNLLRHFRLQGHEVQDQPNDHTDLLLTSAVFGEPTPWRQALLFTARKRFSLKRLPTLITLLHAPTKPFKKLIDHFRSALATQPPDPADFDFPGLAPQAHRVLIEHGLRGGPILPLSRMLQVQSKSIRVLLIVGDEEPSEAYHFDLVGSHPRTPADDLEAFYADIVLRVVTNLSTHEVTDHAVVDDPISARLWNRLTTPAAMRQAGREFGARQFLTGAVRVADVVHVPAVSQALASQYSEGCFATWDPELGALIATVTGSARPIDKSDLQEEDLAVIVGVRPDGEGALVRHVQAKHNDPPSSEAVELFDMDSMLPGITLGPGWQKPARVPVVRSKLHGHRGVAAYDPWLVEHVALDEPYYHYPVSCATQAQARAIRAAFTRSEALQHPEDRRQIVFTVLPCHGVVIAEKWVRDKAPFQAIWEAMDTGALQVVDAVPQGLVRFVPGTSDTLRLQPGG